MQEESKKERRRRIAVPTMFGIEQEISLAAHGKMDTTKGGKEKLGETRKGPGEARSGH